MKQIRRWGLLLISCLMLSVVFRVYAANSTAPSPEVASAVLPQTEEISPQEPIQEPTPPPTRSYLFIHDTSTNMRKRQRISIMQRSIREVLDALPPAFEAGLRAFGHRFPLEGPDVCDDTDIVIPVGSVSSVRDDFENYLNTLADPVIGGGSPVGLSLQQGIADLQYVQGAKEIYLYAVDMMKCAETNPLTVLQAACEVENLHVTVIGFGLRADLQTLNEYNIPRLSCVDILNMNTAEDADALPERLLTRVSVAFRNADGQFVDPKAGERILLQLAQTVPDGTSQSLWEKMKEPQMKGSFIDTVGVPEGTYLLDVSYQGQKLRKQQEIKVSPRKTTLEVIQLGRLDVVVTDSQGALIDPPQTRLLEIRVTDAGKTIRTASNVTQATFDLIPGNKYNVQVSYMVGGAQQTVEFERTVAIQEGNHQKLTIPLPLGSLGGKILNMDGTPAERVEVLLSGIVSAEGAKKMSRKAMTDAQGQYLFPDLPANTYELQIKHPGFKPEKRQVALIGGQFIDYEDIALFHGIETVVLSTSGTPVENAVVTFRAKASLADIPIRQRQHVYRNEKYLPAGEYQITVSAPGYVSAAQEVTLRDNEAFVEVPLTLPYYVTVQGLIINGKGEPVPDAVVTFQQQHTKLMSDPEQAAPISEPSAPPAEILSGTDGTFHATLLIQSPGDETATIVWRDIYNQEYTQQQAFPLPVTPQAVDLQTLRLPINYVRLALTDVLGYGITADTILVAHRQSGQTGFAMRLLENGRYESTALPDGDYFIRVLKEGYQEAEQKFSIAGGKSQDLSATLYHYVTLTGTVIDGKGTRLAGAVVTLGTKNSEQLSAQAVTTGRDGRFQTTVLVKRALREQIAVQWSSAQTGRTYHVETDFALPGIPIADFYPMNVGEYQLPANTLSVRVQDVSGRGLRAVQVTFISEQGEQIPGEELGDGLYQSPDLADGTYDVAIVKAGYKEHVFLPDVFVGGGSRNVQLGTVTLPHYVTVTGTVVNGKDEAVANTVIRFGNQHSEQLEPCQTDQHGNFTTTLLVQGAAEETWNALWKKDEYRATGIFLLPGHPDAPVNLGNIRLPINFISIPVENIYAQPLRNVKVDITYIEGTPIKLEEFVLEEIEAGLYQAQNLPDGIYTIALEKEGYEIGRHVNVTVKGGQHETLKPMTLGHYVTVYGTAINGKLSPVVAVDVQVAEQASTLLLPELEKTASGVAQQAQEAAPGEPQLAGPKATLRTDEQGNFTAKLLVRTSGAEQFVLSWGDHYSASYHLPLLTMPGIQQEQFHLPMNFVTVQVADISRKPLSEAKVTFTHQTEKVIFPAEERDAGRYETQGIPDGNYIVVVSKDRYAEYTETIAVQGGEVKETSVSLNHYVTVKGRVINGKREKVPAATIQFDALKTMPVEKLMSGPDGAFEAELLVRELGREAGHIIWSGPYGSHTTDFLLDLPDAPTVVTLPEEETRLPINFISLEVKSVAATGVPGATVTLTHRESGQTIAARDLDNGNYEGQELPNGTYDITIAKQGYKTITVDQATVEQGQHLIGLPVPKFLHYITMSGVVLNGKRQGVAEATVMVKKPKRLQDCEAVSTRADGSFTLSALVTDVGAETLDVVWKEHYAITVPVPLPVAPEQMHLEEIILPVNFIIVNVQNIIGDSIAGATVLFVQKGWELETREQSPLGIQFTAQETAPGIYDSPELPDGEYLVIARKEGYIQQQYPTIAVQAGKTVSDITLKLPHLVTVSGAVHDGKQQGLSGVTITFGGQHSQQATAQITTDADGHFTEVLQVAGTGQETISATITYPPLLDAPGEQFVVSQDFELLSAPGEQHVPVLRLPINYIPIHVQDVAGRPITDADVVLTRQLAQTEGKPKNQTGQALLPKTNMTARSISTRTVKNLGQGKYEGIRLPDGNYTLTISKAGYEPQTRVIAVQGGEVSPEAAFVLAHYVTVTGMVTNGKGDGVPDTMLEFDSENSTLVSDISSSQSATAPTIRTDAKGYFAAIIRIKKVGAQRIRAVWQDRYIREYTFPLPEQPQTYTLESDIRLPVNFVPLRVMNVLEEGLAGVDITLQQREGNTADVVHFHSLGSGLYEAQHLVDGTYAMTVAKPGYQESRTEITVQGGEQLAERWIVLPHFVTIRGKVVNGKGVGVNGAQIRLAGLNSQLVTPNATLTTQADGNFQMELVVTGATGLADLREHLEIAWETQARTFSIAHDFILPALPGQKNLGVLTLPANFATVAVQDVSGKGLANVNVVFIDQQGQEFPAQDNTGGFYEGQNLPDGIYTVRVSKAGYQEASKEDVPLGATSLSTEAQATREPLAFRLPYYVTLQGNAVDGKGQILTKGLSLELEGARSQLLPETVVFRSDGNFEAKLMVSASGKESFRITYTGEHDVHVRQIEFVLPQEPATVDVRRIILPINYIPIEVNDLRGYGLTGATVTLQHEISGQKIVAQELGDGKYEGQALPDGQYRMTVAKEGYKSVESELFRVADGIVSEPQSFKLQHYVWLTGLITNGEGNGVRDPTISVERLRSREIQKYTDITGKFEVKLEVQEVGNEKLYIEWKNMYRTSFLFKLPNTPEQKNLGEIRLPINFLAIVVMDISGSTLRDVDVTVENSGGVLQTLKTDQNGLCKTTEIPDGLYTITVKKAGYTIETREVYASDGAVVPVRFTLPHYVVIQGKVKDIRNKAVSGVAILFDEFTDSEGQPLRTSTDVTGAFEQKLLVTDPKFLQHQRGHFRIKKGNVEQVFTFKIPAEPNQIASYRTLLFPTNYLLGKIVDAEIKAVPLAGATVTLGFIPEQSLAGIPFADSGKQGGGNTETQHLLRFTTDELGQFEAGDLQEGEYKVTIQKEGYLIYEDFVRISGLLQEKEFALTKEMK